MSETPEKKKATSELIIPHRWRVFLIGPRMRVIAELSTVEGVSAQQFEPVELADFLLGEGLALADVGEFLVRVECLSPAREAKMKLSGKPARSLMMRSLSGGAAPLSLCVLSDTLEPASPCLGEAVLAWGRDQADRVGALFPKTRGSGALEALVVDAHADRRECTQRLLRKLGCRALGASSAGEALAFSKAKAFELVLIDAGIPGIGAPALRELLRSRAGEQWGYDPSIAMLGGASTLDGPGNVQKPVSVSGLARATEGALRLRAQRVSDPLYLADLPVLELGVWEQAPTLLGRLANTLVGQGLEFFSKREKAGAGHDSKTLKREVYSLKSGADILQALRFSAVCGRILGELSLHSEQCDPSSFAQLAVEFERFRSFVEGRGLL